VIEADGTTTRAPTRALAFANGIAIDETTLWIIESAAPAVSAMSLDDTELVRVIELERCVPDGLALDAAGGLLISCYQPNQLWRWTEDNGLELIFDEWTGELILSPTNVAFCGENLERLALASLCGHDIVTIAPHTLVHQFDFHDRNDMAEVISTIHRPARRARWASPSRVTMRFSRPPGARPTPSMTSPIAHSVGEPDCFGHGRRAGGRRGELGRTGTRRDGVADGSPRG